MEPVSLFISFVLMASLVSGAKELQMHQKGYLLLFWRLYSAIFEACLALKHHTRAPDGATVAEMWLYDASI